MLESFNEPFEPLARIAARPGRRYSCRWPRRFQLQHFQESFLKFLPNPVPGRYPTPSPLHCASRLNAGEIQVMSAGAGVVHSEYNPSSTNDLNFLQVWIRPTSKGGGPRYAQHDFSAAQGITLVVSPDGRDGSLSLQQDASIYLVKLSQSVEDFETRPGRVYYLHVARGALNVNDTGMTAGDGATISGEMTIRLAAASQGEALLFDLRSN